MSTETATLEVHTSDLTSPCLRRVDLRLRGKAIGITESAKAGGLLWHEAVQQCHADNRFDAPHAAAIVSPAWARVQERCKAENQPLSPAVTRDLTTLCAEVAQLLPVYGERVASTLGKVIGCELPIRCTIDVDGEPVEFASHIDLLCRFPSGSLGIVDWKYGKEAPTFWELSRNMQFGMYGYAARHGAIMVDGEWVEFGEWPSLYWCQIRNLRGFGRATTVKEYNSEQAAWEEVPYAKGQQRPIEKIMIPSGVYPEGEAEILRRFAEHVRLRRMGIMPAIPGEHCQFCDSVKFCGRLGGEGAAY